MTTKKEKIIVKMPNGKTFEVDTVLRNKRKTKPNKDAQLQLEKTLKGYRYKTKEVKK